MDPDPHDPQILRLDLQDIRVPDPATPVFKYQGTLVRASSLWYKSTRPGGFPATGIKNNRSYY
eukprot:2076352-Rhodomonas_salina.2